VNPVDELIAAWEAWDEKPGAADRVDRRLAALKAVVGDRWLDAHREIAAYRREGMPPAEAIRAAVGEAS
jgi:hypothetical protein